jgi:hypothetical protein
MPDDDKKRAAYQALVDRILTGERKAPEEQRAQAFGNDGLASPLNALVGKVVARPVQVTQADFAAAKAAGFSEDQLFELVICAAAGRSAGRMTRHKVEAQACRQHSPAAEKPPTSAAYHARLQPPTARKTALYTSWLRVLARQLWRTGSAHWRTGSHWLGVAELSRTPATCAGKQIKGAYTTSRPDACTRRHSRLRLSRSRSPRQDRLRRRCAISFAES